MNLTGQAIVEVLNGLNYAMEICGYDSTKYEFKYSIENGDFYYVSAIVNHPLDKGLILLEEEILSRKAGFKPLVDSLNKVVSALKEEDRYEDLLFISTRNEISCTVEGVVHDFKTGFELLKSKLESASIR